MVKEIEQAVLGNLDWLVSRFKSLTVKFIGFVVTCWVVIGAIWIGLVLPVKLMNGKVFHGDEAKVVFAKGALSKQVSDYRSNTVPSRMNYQVPVNISKSASSKPVVRDEIRNVTNTVNE